MPLSVGFLEEIDIVTAIGSVTILPILPLCNENNDITKMLMKKLKKKKKTVRYSNYDALKIAIFLIQRAII